MSNYDDSKTYRTDAEILLREIVRNTNDLEVNLGDVDVNLEAVEALLTTIDTDTGNSSNSQNRMHLNQKLNMGGSGSVTIAGNAAQSVSTGTYFAVYFVKDTTPTTLTITNSTTVTGQLYPAGTWIYGDITAITGDSSGMYILYKGAVS